MGYLVPAENIVTAGAETNFEVLWSQHPRRLLPTGDPNKNV